MKRVIVSRLFTVSNRNVQFTEWINNKLKQLKKQLDEPYHEHKQIRIMWKIWLRYLRL